MKEHKVNIRVHEKMKQDLEKLATQNKREFSDYIRLIYQHAIDKKLKF